MMQMGAQWSKLVTVILVIIAASVLAGMKVVGGDAAIGVISACLGYVFGNGHGILEAKRAGYAVDQPAAPVPPQTPAGGPQGDLRGGANRGPIGP